MDFAHTGTGVTTTITGLTADTFYEARVQAENGETPSDWSDASDAVSTNAAMTLPTVEVADGAASEGEDVVFVVTLSAVSGEEVTVDYANVGRDRPDGDLGHGLHGGVERHADHRRGRPGGDDPDRDGDGRRRRERRDLHADDFEPDERDAGHENRRHGHDQQPGDGAGRADRFRGAGWATRR